MGGIGATGEMGTVQNSDGKPIVTVTGPPGKDGAVGATGPPGGTGLTGATGPSGDGGGDMSSYIQLDSAGNATFPGNVTVNGNLSAKKLTGTSLTVPTISGNTTVAGTLTATAVTAPTITATTQLNTDLLASPSNKLTINSKATKITGIAAINTTGVNKKLRI